jgi:hypothetical protein
LSAAAVAPYVAWNLLLGFSVISVAMIGLSAIGAYAMWRVPSIRNSESLDCSVADSDGLKRAVLIARIEVSG